MYKFEKALDYYPHVMVVLIITLIVTNCCISDEYKGSSVKAGIEITMSYGEDGGNEFYYGDTIHFSKTASISVKGSKYGDMVLKNIISTTDGSGNDLFQAFEYSEADGGIVEVACLSYEHEGAWIVGYVSFPTFGKSGDTDFPQHWNNSVTLNEGDIKVSDK